MGACVVCKSLSGDSDRPFLHPRNPQRQMGWGVEREGGREKPKTKEKANDSVFLNVLNFPRHTQKSISVSVLHSEISGER